MFGGALFCGLLPRTAMLLLLAASALPALFVAVTTQASVCSWSTGSTVYVLAVADSMTASPPRPLSRIQRYVKVGAGRALQMPGEQVSDSPTAGGSTPSTFGAVVASGLIPGTCRLLLLSFEALPALFDAVTLHASE